MRPLQSFIHVHERRVLQTLMISRRTDIVIVYAPNMPSALPVPLLLRRLAQQILYGLLFGLRAVFFATIWLAVLPWLTLLAWRFYFAMGESTCIFFIVV